jgi:ABC-type multidrug transport system ATPase subunit
VGISVRGLCKSFSGRGEVVHGIDIDVFKDHVTTLLGRNGAAKTTTL